MDQGLLWNCLVPIISIIVVDDSRLGHDGRIHHETVFTVATSGEFEFESAEEGRLPDAQPAISAA